MARIKHRPGTAAALAHPQSGEPIVADADGVFDVPNDLYAALITFPDWVDAPAPVEERVLTPAELYAAPAEDEAEGKHVAKAPAKSAK